MSWFNILFDSATNYSGIPKKIPFAKVEPFRERCLVAHNQSLEVLNSRGGLSIKELFGHFHIDVSQSGTLRQWFDLVTTTPDETIIEWFKKWLNE